MKTFNNITMSNRLNGLEFENFIKSLSRSYCEQNYSDHPLTIDDLEECFTKAFIFGTQYGVFPKNASLKVGSLYMMPSEDFVISENDRIGKVSYLIGPVIKQFQLIEQYFIFDNKNKTIIRNDEYYMISDKAAPLTEGEYTEAEYIIMRSLKDENFLHEHEQ